MSLTTFNPAALQFTETQDWFSHNIDRWTSLFHIVQSRCPRILEIGSWEGRSAVFLLTNLCKDDGEIVCIDHFDLLRTDAGRERFSKINHNLSLTGKKFRVMSEFSFPALMTLLVEEMSSANPGFDWIYVDGSHEADDTLLDGELAWRLARKNSVIIFDDYHWDKEPEDSIHHPRRGIDAFLALHRGEYRRLSDPAEYQVVLQKVTEMRIGFLVPEKADSRLNEVLGYGIHIALAIDSPYTMPGSVAIRSVIETTPGRISFYIMDCGLSKTDKDRLQASIPRRDDVTMMFVGSTERSLASEMGAVWAKLDAHHLLPMERILYLDADILVRSSLGPLWETDLGGKSIAATTDIGHPMGHADLERKPYFNAGVMVMDLAKVRERGHDLEALGRKMKEARFRDQDALNMHFEGDWFPLDLEWNAQGLGTYARHTSSDRERLDLSSMDDPSIVHFTGPVHPKMVDVLNPYFQPPTSKPWGYADSPGHPFQGEWWAMLDRTWWKGLRDTEGWKSACEKERNAAIDGAIQDFHNRLQTFGNEPKVTG